jgi:hypothetical protein
MKTTLNKIRAHGPCRDGWLNLLRGLGKTAADDETLWIDTVLEHNGLDDALWCLRAVEGCDREIRLYAVWCARRVQHLMVDARSVAALDVAERHARAEASDEELASASATARAATAAAATAAERAASAAAAERAASAAAAERAASAAAVEWAARAAARAATARAEATVAARAAAWATDSWSVRNAERAAQAEELRRICREMRESGR